MGRTYRRIVESGALYLLAAASLAGASEEQGREKQTYRVPESTAQVTIDGRIDEAVWSEALHLELDYEVEPGENIRPPVRSEVFLLSTAKAVVVAFRCHDPDPTRIRARYWDRDQLWSDDWIGIMFDTFNDSRRAYEFIVNPLGVQMDAVNDDVGGVYDRNWDAIWQSAGRITDTGWEAEIAIPFHQIRFQDTVGPQTWGIDVFRSYPRQDRHHIGLFPRLRGANSYLAQADKVVGFAAARTGRDLQLTPTLTWAGGTAREELPDGPMESQGSHTELGATIRWGVTPNMNLSAAANPDFSQVEADAMQLDVNETFALYYPETRPFFLESADYFATPLDLVHTRVIADPAAAVKLTGKQGRHTLGVFSAADELTNLILPGPQGSESASFDLRTTSSAARYRYDLAESSTVGVLFSDRRGGGFSSSVVDVDASYRFSDADKLSGSFAISDTDYSAEMITELDLAEGQVSGHALNLDYRHSERRWNAWGSYRDIGSDFRADLGFMPRVGYWSASGGASLIWWGVDEDFLRRTEAGVDASHVGEEGASWLSRETALWVVFQAPYQSQLRLEMEQGDEAYLGQEFDRDSWQVALQIRPGALVNCGFSAEAGDRIDYVEARAARGLDLAPWVELNLGRHLRLNLSYRFTELELPAGRLFSADLARLRAVYQFNNRLFVRAVLQYVGVERNQELFTDEVETDEKELHSQLLFAYELNPQTVVYLGYSDSSLGTEAHGLARSSSSLFAKVGYALVF